MTDAPAVIINLPGYTVKGIASFSSLPVLRAYPSLSNTEGFNAIVDGGAASGDGGGGFFVWSAASQATDNGTTVVKPSDRTSGQAGRYVLIGAGVNVMSIGTFADIATTTIPLDSNRIRTENGTDYIADAVVTPTFAAAHPTWAIVSKNGRGFRLAPGPVNLEMFGAIPDNTTDCYPAWLGYVDLINYENINGGTIGGGSRWLRAYGPAYYFSNTLNFTRTIRFSGAGTGLSGAAATILRWPPNKGGIIVNAYDTFGEGIRTPGTGGDASIIEGFSLRGGGGTASELKSGVWFRGRGLLRDCTTRTFPGHGWLVRASENSSDPSAVGNANGTTVMHVRSENNVMSGARVMGADANGCWFWGVDFGSNGGWGFQEESFLGPNRWNFQSENNTLGAWMCTGSTNQSIIEGYTEPGQGPASAKGASIAYGAQYAGFTADSTCPYVSGDSSLDGGGVSSSTGWYTRRKRSDGMTLRTISGANGAYLAMTAFTAGGANYETHKLTAGAMGDLQWSIDDFYVPYRITMRVKYGRSSNVENAIQVTKLFVGDAENAREIGGSGTMPTSGENARGDYIRNLDPVPAGGKILMGWFRLTTGSGHVLDTDWVACYGTTS